MGPRSSGPQRHGEANTCACGSSERPRSSAGSTYVTCPHGSYAVTPRCWCLFRRLTQVNCGRHTPGIDGARVTTPDERAQLVDDRRQYHPWQAAPVRRVDIPKANGTQRPLGIPTRRDRVRHMVVKNALEPRFEAEFAAPSDGFRPGRCGQDARAEVDVALNNRAVGHHHDSLDADIQGAFDHSRQDVIRHRIGPMPGRELSKPWLKAGYWAHGTRPHTTEGPPRAACAAHCGGISPAMDWPNSWGKATGSPGMPMTWS
jgi:hypothetical protein